METYFRSWCLCRRTNTEAQPGKLRPEYFTIVTDPYLLYTYIIDYFFFQQRNMSIVKTVVRVMERVAPLRLAEKWDNVSRPYDRPHVLYNV